MRSEYLSEDGEALLNKEKFMMATKETILESNSQQWYAVYANSRHEMVVNEKLRMREIESFLPIQRSVRRWKNGCKKTLELPLFPSYLFVRIGRKERGRVLGTPGVISLVGSAIEPVPVPDREIEMLRQGISERVYEPHQYLSVGQKVRIKNGAMKDMVGILVRKKNDARVVLNVDIIRQGVAVDIDMDEIELIASVATGLC